MVESHDTNRLCPVCGRGKVVIETGHVATESEMNIPIGPASAGYYTRQVLSIHCKNPSCQILFHSVPGDPEAVSQLMRELAEKDSDERRRRVMAGEG